MDCVLHLVNVCHSDPFELALRIPRSGWHGLYSIGLRIALHSAVEQYRSYLAQANNI